MRFKRTTIIAVLLLVVLSLSVTAQVSEEVHQAFLESNEVSVIILLNDEVEEGEVAIQEIKTRKEIVKDLQKDVLKDLDVKRSDLKKRRLFARESYDLDLKREYPLTNGFAGKLTQEGLSKLENDPRVKGVFPNKIRHIFLDESTAIINADQAWSTSVDDTQIDGSGETVCVIDTGIDYRHPALGGCSTETFLAGDCSKVIGGHDFVNDDADPLDDQGHGTHVAGIIASNDSTYSGVAPQAKIAALKVCNPAGECADADVIAALDWCIDNAALYNISIISMSLGGEQTATYCDADLGVAYAPSINQAVANNISVIVATGNTNNNLPDPIAGIAVPACVQSSLRVSATDDNDLIPGYAFRHSFFDDILLAPGDSIESTKMGGGFKNNSGTSMATPHISGALALLNQFMKLQGEAALTPAQLLDTINSTGIIIDDSAGSGLNFSRVDIYVALQSLDTTYPSITIVDPTPSNNSVILENSVTINITASETLTSAILEFNGLNESMQGSGTNFFITKDSLEGFDHSFRVYASDIGNNTNLTDLQLFTIDSAPQISFRSPTNNSFYKANFILNISIIGNENLSTSWYNITNSLGEVIQSEANISIDVTSLVWISAIEAGELPEDEYTLNVFANNTINEVTTRGILFTVDRTLPALYGKQIDKEIIYNDDIITFRVNSTDNSLVNIFFESNFSGSLVNYTMLNEANETYKFVLEGLDNLTNQANISYRFYAVDGALNTNSSAQFSFVVVNRVPGPVEITKPVAQGVIELGSEAECKATATDLDQDFLSYNWEFSDGSTQTGENFFHTFNVSGEITLNLNVTDSHNSNSTTMTVIVNDTQGPQIVNVNYAEEVHLQEDGNQEVEVTVTDPSGLADVVLVFDESSLEGNCSSTNLEWECTWRLGSLILGEQSFTINTTDDSEYAHTSSELYEFEVVSCADDEENGDEEGVDCGGSCADSCEAQDDDNDDGADDNSASSSAGGSSAGGGGGSPSNSDSNEIAENNDEVIDEVIEEEVVQEVALEEVIQEEEQGIEVLAAEQLEDDSGFFSTNLVGAAIFNRGKELFTSSSGTWVVIVGTLLTALLGISLFMFTKRKRVYDF